MPEAMTDERKKWVKEQLAQLVASNNDSKGEGGQSKVAKMLSISSATISTICNGTYAAKGDDMMLKLEEYFLTKQTAARMHKGASYKPLTISENILKELEYCQLKGKITCITGDAGIGKTMAATRYMEMHPTSTISITGVSGFKSVRMLMEMLCDAIGIEYKGQYATRKRIAEKLHDGMLIICDEAQFFTMAQIEHLRGYMDMMHDNGQTLGIALLGNLKTTDKFDSTSNTALDQLSSRTRRSIHHATEVQRADIEMLFPEVTDSAASVDFLLKTAREKGISLRNTCELYSVAADNGNVSYGCLRAAAKFVAGSLPRK